MLWNKIESHDKVIKLLQQQIKADRIGHAYLFVGKNGIGKSLVAKAFAADIMKDKQEELVEDNKHPDFKLWETDKKTIGVSTVRDMQEGLFLYPTQALRKVIMISEGEKLTVQAQNALLKVLEDPPERTTFLILIESLAHMLPTLISRCQIIKFAPLNHRSILRIVDTSNLGDAEEALLLFLGKGSVDNFKQILAEISLQEIINELQEIIRLIDKREDYNLYKRSSYLLKNFELQFVLDCFEIIWELALREDPSLEVIIGRESEYFRKTSSESIARACKLIIKAKKDEAKYVNKQLILETLLIELLEANYDKRYRC